MADDIGQGLQLLYTFYNQASVVMCTVSLVVTSILIVPEGDGLVQASDVLYSNISTAHLSWESLVEQPLVTGRSIMRKKGQRKTLCCCWRDGGLLSLLAVTLGKYEGRLV